MSWNARHVWAVGEILTASAHNSNDSDLDYIPPEWDYAQITANVSITATTEATAQAVVTGNSVTYDGGRVQVECFFPGFDGGQARLVFLRDTTVLGDVYNSNAGGNPAQAVGLSGRVFDTPTAAAHTYAVKAFSTGATCTVNAGPGGSGSFVPGFLRVTAAKAHP